jgi:hypothetical protein
MSHTPEHQVWADMRYRCSNPNGKSWHLYGGRGIKVCSRWTGSNGFANFYTDVGPRPSPLHSIERVENSGDYDPSNCKWATPREQSNNFRRNRPITYAGRTMNQAEWARFLGIGIPTLKNRIRSGWPLERALSPEIHKGWTKTSITFGGETLSMTEWAKRKGLPFDVLRQRLGKLHWPVEKALSQK